MLDIVIHFIPKEKLAWIAEFKCRDNYSKVILKGLSKVLNLGASCTTQVSGGERREKSFPPNT